ncbi:NaeI family type II restriction endonuclease [Streptomyces sp. NPDC088730]|uniref:NaeI family type II restriction endonuclease n=1 Tax=Streptomyces sp. NPDC088730 TaxID=3365877 RepID=UPI00380C3BAF
MSEPPPTAPTADAPGPGAGPALAGAVAALHAAVPELDATAVAEALWLAARMAAATATEGGTGTAPERGGESRPGVGDPLPAEPSTDAPPAGRDRGAGRAVHERLPGSGTRVPGDAVTASRGGQLPRALEVSRALRPWKRQWRTGRRQEVDVDATVRSYARSGELIPAFSAAPERWFDLVLVVDRSPSMQVWEETADAFATVLDRLGAFRTLQVQDLTFTAGAEMELRDRQGRPTAPGRLRSPDGRRLVVAVSDFTAEAWRGPQVWKQLRAWSATTPVALLSPLPATLWRRTGLDLPAARVSPGAPGAPNARLSFERPPLLPPPEGAGSGGWLPLPVLSLSPHSLGRWSRTVMRAAPDGCGAVLVPPGGRVQADGRSPRQPPRSPEERTENFLRTAAPPSARLAVLSSAFDRLSLPLLHLISQELVPEAATADLAELLTSSLFTLETRIGGAVELVVPPQVQPLLRQHLAERDVWRLQRALSRFVAARGGGRGGLPAVAAVGPDGGRGLPDVVELPAELRPFAQASLRTLELLGLASSVSSTGRTRRRPVPDQLPEQTDYFTGRQAAVATVSRLVTASGTPTVCITAPRGVHGAGATALMLFVAGRVKDQFEDGLLYADLHSADISSVLYGFLRALGVPAESIPAGAADMAELYRSTLVGRRVLIVLDNPSKDSASKLFPAGSGCAVLATGDAGEVFGSVVRLEPLDEASVRALTRRVAPSGDGLNRSEPYYMGDAWPLAVKVVAQWAATDGDALTLLRAVRPAAPRRVAGWDLHTVLDIRLTALAPATLRGLLLLALHPRARLAPEEISVLLGTGEVASFAVTDDLVRAGLLEVSPDGLHHLHDAVRGFARARALRGIPPAQWRVALERLVAHHARIVVAAYAREHPEDPFPDHVVRGPDAGQRPGVRRGRPEEPHSPGSYVSRHPHLFALLTPGDSTEDVALRTRAGLLVILRDVTDSPRHRTAFERAADRVSGAAHAAQDQVSHGWAQLALAWSQLSAHRFSRAGRTLSKLPEAPPPLRSMTLRLEAAVAGGTGDTTTAESLLTRSAELAREEGDPFNEAQALRDLAGLLAALGQPGSAPASPSGEPPVLPVRSASSRPAGAGSARHAPAHGTGAAARPESPRAVRATEHLTVIMADTRRADASLIGRLLRAVRLAGAKDADHRVQDSQDTLTVTVARRVPVARIVDGLLEELPTGTEKPFSVVVHTGPVHRDFTGAGISAARQILRSPELNRAASTLRLLNLLAVSDAAMARSELPGGPFTRVRLTDEARDAWLYCPDSLAADGHAAATGTGPDTELSSLHSVLVRSDPDGRLMAGALRDAFDFVLDGSLTGRFDLTDLSRAERTVIGVKVEQTIMSAFALRRGQRMDLSRDAVEFDLRFSTRLGGWAFPPENEGEICLLVHADDAKGRWGAGLMRIESGLLRPAGNRDGKRGLRPDAVQQVRWLHRDLPLPENVLLHLDPDDRSAVLASASAQQRVNELFRRALGRRITTATLNTLAGPDGSRRARDSRKVLAAEGITVLSHNPQDIELAKALRCAVPRRGEFVSVRTQLPASAVPGS